MKKINWKVAGIWAAAFAIPFGHAVLAAYYIHRWYLRKHRQKEVK